MKKLLALLVIIIFTTSIVIAVENPFSFGISNTITLKAVEESQPGRMQAAQDDINGYSPDNDFNVTKANLNDTMKCSASITLAEIYTMGYYLQGAGEYGFGGDAMRTAFEAGMTNGIQVVPDYLKIDINAAWEVRWESRDADAAEAENIEYIYISEADAQAALLADDPTLTAADVQIDFDDDGVFNEGDSYLNAGITDNDTSATGQHTAMLLKPSLALGGSIPDTGITWKIAETIEMEWNPENWKDTDPTYTSWDGDAYDPATGAVTAAIGGEQNGSFDYAKFITQIDFGFEFFHFFAPENITGTISAMYAFKVKVPYSYYLEKDKELVNEANLKFTLGLAGVTTYLGVFLETADYANNSAPLDGDNKSLRSWDGTWIGLPADSMTEWDDEFATSHARPNMKIGPLLGFSYSKEWLSFGLNYKGYLDGIRKWDESGMNSVQKWANEFDISVGFSL
jgi:hypothetical protein